MEVRELAELYGIYRCEICGNVIEVLHAGAGELVCCGQPMKLLTEKTEDAGMEKHVPVVERSDGATRVRVGSVPHPMEEKHFIEWIEILTENGVMRRFLKPGEAPGAEFRVEEKIVKVRDYCNVHGLWKKEL
jgi:superoxide reductase